MFELFQMWALVEVLGLTCLPLTIIVFHNLADRGWAFSKTLAMVVLAFCVWSPLMYLHFLPFSQLFIIGVTLLCLLCGLFGWFRLHQQLFQLMRDNLAYIIAAEAIFLGMVFLLGWLRIFKPEISGAEMFMDEGFISAIMRSSHLPPNDMWLAGHSINYYYYAHFTIAMLAKLLGQPSFIAFNTGISIFFGLTAVSFFGVTCNIVAWACYLRTHIHKGVDMPSARSAQSRSSLLRAMPYGVLSFIMALILGNLAATQQWWQNHGEGTHFNWWTPTRVIPHTINEFPAFSFLLSCFHAHVLALAFTILAIALAFNLFLERIGKGLHAFGYGRRLTCTVLVTGLTLGALFAMNGWDYPTYTVLVLICLVLQQWLVYHRHIDRTLCFDIVSAAAVLIALSLLLYLPFYLNFVSPAQGIGLVPTNSRSQIGDEMLIYGLFGFIFLSLLLASAAKRPFSGPMSAYVDYRSTLRVLPLLLLADLAIFLFLPNSVTFLVISNIVVFAVLLAFYHINDHALAFVLLLGALAFALVAGCEIFYLRDTFDGSADMRLNTLFKYYFEAWALLSIASGAGLFFIFESFRPFKTASRLQRWSLRITGNLWSMGLLLLLLAAAVYPVLAPAEREPIYNFDTHTLLAPPSASLDGLSYLNNYLAAECQCRLDGDYAAIRWLNANVQGDPVIVEAMSQDYSIYGRVSVFTGLPDLVNWYGHEQQWRANWLKLGSNNDDYQRRGPDIDQIYTNPDAHVVLATMARYQAQYLYVGQLELAKYSKVDLHRFSAFMQVIYRAHDVTIYEMK